MNALEIKSLLNVASETLARANAETDALAALIVRDGVPADWSVRLQDEAFDLLANRRHSLPQIENFSDLRESLTAAIRILRSRSGF